MKSEKGFSLVELLVVVIIIAIVAAIAIPNLLSSRRAANEASAISSLRTIHSAEATYQATQGNSTVYGDLAGLTGAGLIDSALAGATAAATAKSGYVFALTRSTGNDLYCATATPAGTTSGTRIFGVGSDGVIYVSAPDGTTPPTCAAGVRAGGVRSIELIELSVLAPQEPDKPRLFFCLKSSLSHCCPTLVPNKMRHASYWNR
jgi:type IV pilus assembly protein PilA